MVDNVGPQKQSHIIIPPKDKKDEIKNFEKQMNELTKEIDKLQEQVRKALIDGKVELAQKIEQKIQNLKTHQEFLMAEFNSISHLDLNAQEDFLKVQQDSTARANGPSIFGNGFGQE